MSGILVTGGAGYIGSKIVFDLIKKRKKVVIIDNLSTGFKSLINKKSIFYKIDFSSRLVKEIVKDNNIQTIIHCAASTNVAEANKNKKKYFLNNVSKTEIFLKNVKDLNIKNFIYSSTCAVYGNINSKVTENTKVKPTNIYGLTKLKAEQLIKKYSRKYNFKYAILRYFNVAGADNFNKIGIYKNSGQLIKNIAINCVNKRNFVNIFGNKYHTEDGTCIRDFIHINDISKIHILALNKIDKSRSNLILNCGSGKEYSILNIISRFEKIYKIKIVKKISPKRDGDIVRMVCDNIKLKTHLKFKIEFDIDDIIKSSVNWERKNG